MNPHFSIHSTSSMNKSYNQKRLGYQVRYHYLMYKQRVVGHYLVELRSLGFPQWLLYKVSARVFEDIIMVINRYIPVSKSVGFSVD